MLGGKCTRAGFWTAFKTKISKNKDSPRSAWRLCKRRTQQVNSYPHTLLLSIAVSSLLCHGSPAAPVLASLHNLGSETDITSIADKPNSPGLILNLPSNNPFRNRTTSPTNSLPSPRSSNFNANGVPERPRSRNPFLDNDDQPDFFAPQPVRPLPGSPQKMSGGTSPVKGGLYGNTAELFVSLRRAVLARRANDTYRIILPLTRVKQPATTPVNHLRSWVDHLDRKTSHHLNEDLAPPCINKIGHERNKSSGQGMLKSLGVPHKH